MKTRQRSIRATVTGAALAMATLSGRAEGVLDPWGPIGATQRQLLYECLGVMLLVVVPVIVLTLAFGWWFRASNQRATYRPDWSYSGRIEFTIWIIPLLIVLFLAGVAWVGSHELDPFRPLGGAGKRLRVEVVAMDWKWLFIYPELGVASINELALPLDTPVNMNITSASVMNAIFIPGLAGQIYAMAGMCTQMSVIAGKTGVYRGLSSQFSGDGFSDMKFKVIAADGPGFERWIDGLRRSGQVLDKPAYERLLGQRASTAASYYASADGDLFDYALQRGTKPPSAIKARTVDPRTGVCRDMNPTNGVN
ncbi:MAG: ubiquinol oxidase subunit [Ramlibacter sp.]|nr:ubiquinol oxidase subunit [Ramlibacter sp.]